MTGWPALLRRAAGMGVTPEAFWRLSVAEWRAIAAPPPSHALGWGDLRALMAAWPDEGGAVPLTLPHRCAARAPPSPRRGEGF